LTLVLFFVDALAARDITPEAMPHLASHWRTHGSPVKPLPAFEGIGVTIFTGRWPDEHGIWTNFERCNRKLVPYERLFFAYDFVLRHDGLRWMAKYLTYRVFHAKVPIPNQIPAPFLTYFRDALSTDPSIVPSIGNFSTIRGMVETHGRRYLSINATSPGDD
jgi:hypothetical protein